MLNSRHVHFVDSVRSPTSTTSTLSSVGPPTPPSHPNTYPYAPDHVQRFYPPHVYVSPPAPYTPSAIHPPVVPPHEAAHVSINPALAANNLVYDVTQRPSSTNPVTSAAILDSPASYPPTHELVIRCDGFPWSITATPASTISSDSQIVTVQDALQALYANLRQSVKASEYDRLKSDPEVQAAVYHSFQARCIAAGSQQQKATHDQGLRRVDLLRGRTQARGLIPGSKENEWFLVLV
ncbi:hypothetical protein EW146_g5960 [Bondarzewia mesenterica]|uniref:DUF6699 domain-containing protein n=1 Tax=Bondarzewia mesenterica TaxID=1095465 RepID=A0A4S4LPX6_9AGAM|nr:hypothetical protein EW146_g5960 [Bondarzewia mesenterica]